MIRKKRREKEKERERERENKREKGWQVGLVLFLAARIQVQNPPPPLLVLCVLRRLSPRLRAWNGEEWMAHAGKRWRNARRRKKTSRGMGGGVKLERRRGARFDAAGFELMVVCRGLCCVGGVLERLRRPLLVAANQGWVPFKPRSGCSAAAERHLANPKGLPFH